MPLPLWIGLITKGLDMAFVHVSFNCAALAPANIQALAGEAAHGASCELPEGEDATAKAAARCAAAKETFIALLAKPENAAAKAAIVCKKSSIHFRCKRKGFGAMMENKDMAARHGIVIEEGDFMLASETFNFTARITGGE